VLIMGVKGTTLIVWPVAIVWPFDEHLPFADLAGPEQGPPVDERKEEQP
jgi:hypothetical protein